jgi:hypothetical protein
MLSAVVKLRGTKGFRGATTYLAEGKARMSVTRESAKIKRGGCIARQIERTPELKTVNGRFWPGAPAGSEGEPQRE